MQAGTFVGSGAIGSVSLAGAAGPDVIRINPAQAGKVEVVINGANQGTFAPTEHLEIHAGAGDDVVYTAPGVTLSVWLFGEAGNDVLDGGAGDDVVLGGAAIDLLSGGGGRDLLIGGLGVDLLLGGGGDDVLIGGSTAHDDSSAALALIQAEWTSSRPHAVRVANIRDGAGSPDRLNGAAFLQLAATVFDDDAIDILFGGSDRDWFFRPPGRRRDVIGDAAPGEPIN
jgi:Ca2+-binding RTX toxin-like protein